MKLLNLATKEIFYPHNVNKDIKILCSREHAKNQDPTELYEYFTQGCTYKGCGEGFPILENLRHLPSLIKSNARSAIKGLS